MEVLEDGGIELSLESHTVTAESAADTALAAAEELQFHIESAASTQRASIDALIERASCSGERSVRHISTQSINQRVYSTDEIEFIEFFADATSGLVAESLRADGFKVKTKAEEVQLNHHSLYPTEYVTRYKVSSMKK